MGRRWCTVLLAAACAAAVIGFTPSRIRPAAAQTERTVPGFDTERPRAVYTPGTEAELAARLDREPYRSIFLDAHALHEARRLSRTPGDPSREAQKDMTRAARFLAFAYAIDRTVVDGEIVPFPTPEARLAAGEIVEELLLGLYQRSRFAVPAPIGGWDRDIDTAAEILQWAGAFDTLLGAGFDFEGNDEIIAERLTDVTSELYRNYTRPETAGGVAELHQNNHRSKSGAAMATAAVVLAEFGPDPADDPDGSRNPLAWWDYGITLVDEALRYILVTGDGAYAEGPHYERFTTETMAPFFGMWDRLLGDASWTTGDGRVVPAIHRTAQFGFTQDWMLALTLPDGTLAPIDDANTHEAHYFGALPTLPNQGSYAWRWANAEPAHVWEATTDLAVDSLMAFDDTVVAEPPAGSPTSFWYEGGNAVFRSDWSTDATMVIAQAEGITASLFGRDSNGIGRAPQSHEHMEPGSFLLYAHGSTLVLDPGYFTFGTHGQVLEARDHNMVLVNGAGPEAMLLNSINWRNDPTGPPPQDGFATLHNTLDTDRIDGASVTTRYGAAASGTDIQLDRDFLFVDDRYLLITDEIVPDGDESVTLDWVLHGNGGATSGGTYVAEANGGTWTHDDARLTSAVATSVGAPTITSRVEEHEVPDERRAEATHEAQYATVSAAGTVRALQVLVPSALADTAPTIETETGPDGTITVSIDDPAAGRAVEISLGDAGLTLDDRAVEGPDVIAYATGDTVETGDVTLRAPGASAVALATGVSGGWEIVATDPAHSLFLDGLGAGHLDHGCAAEVSGDRVRIDPSGADRVLWSPSPVDGRPGAVANAPATRVDLGTEVRLDGRASCDPDGGRLTPQWQLVSAPRGSAWQLGGADGWTPSLLVDAPGTFRVRLTVTDRDGHRSDPVDVVLTGGDRCGDERDDDLDGLFDAADPDCDGPEPPFPTDAVGFLRTGYIGSIAEDLGTATVRRRVDGSPALVAMTGRDGTRRMTVLVRSLGDDDRGTGVIVLIDPDADQREVRRWTGRIIEFAPGVIAGADDKNELIWVVVDTTPPPRN
ncbi:MAG: heparinase II/III family protein [Acidimicrobiales bacterium]